jgi:hypothetical protein
MKLSMFACAAFLSLACATSPGAVAAPHDTASAHPPASDEGSAPITTQPSDPMLERAMALYAAHDYRAAADAFEAAYTREASPSLLLARAQALRLSGNCDAALPLYERFLEAQTDPTYTNAVRPIMATCLDAQDAAERAVARVK